mmetsp:Transcript_4387/g.14477  ORF Transcript_4387/g.14477 Transcript_4387/m.14477 type:complete len:98 (+) Transcript_4387:2002-2295(+)
MKIAFGVLSRDKYDVYSVVFYSNACAEVVLFGEWQSGALAVTNVVLKGLGQNISKVTLAMDRRRRRDLEHRVAIFLNRRHPQRAKQRRGMGEWHVNR